MRVKFYINELRYQTLCLLQDIAIFRQMKNDRISISGEQTVAVFIDLLLLSKYLVMKHLKDVIFNVLEEFLICFGVNQLTDGTCLFTGPTRHSNEVHF